MNNNANENKDPKTEEALTPEIVRSAQNLDGEGVFSASKGRKGLRIINKFITLKDGSKIPIKITVGIDGETLHLGTYEQEVYYYLVNLWNEQGCNKEGVVYFTTYDCLKKMKLSDSGENYKWVKDRIINLRYTPIQYDGSF